MPFSNRAAENLMRYEVLKEKPAAFVEKVFLKEESGGALHRVIYLNQLRRRRHHVGGSGPGSREDAVGISTADKGVWRDGEWY